MNREDLIEARGRLEAFLKPLLSLKARIKSLYHLGVKLIARSTFADANHYCSTFLC